MSTSSPVDSTVTLRPSIEPMKETIPQSGFPLVPSQGEGAVPLRRHEGQVVGEAAENLGRGPLEHVPVDDVGLSGFPGVERRPSQKVIQWAHGGVLLCGPLAFRWTTVVRPSFSGAECASRRPGRGGAGRRGQRDRRVAAEHVT